MTSIVFDMDCRTARLAYFSLCEQIVIRFLPGQSWQSKNLHFKDLACFLVGLFRHCFLYFCLFYLNWEMKFCWSWNSNCRSLVSDVTAYPTELQPLSLSGLPLLNAWCSFSGLPDLALRLFRPLDPSLSAHGLSSIQVGHRLWRKETFYFCFASHRAWI